MTGSLTLARLQRNPECQSVDTKPNKSFPMILNFMPRKSPVFGQTPKDDISSTMTPLRCSKKLDFFPKPTGVVNAPIRSMSISNGEESQFQNESCFSEAVNQMNRNFGTPEFDFFSEKKDRDLRPTSAYGIVKKINTEQPQKSDEEGNFGPQEDVGGQSKRNFSKFYNQSNFGPKPEESTEFWVGSFNGNLPEALDLPEPIIREPLRKASFTTESHSMANHQNLI
jgi:hypothetical protein